MPYLECKTKDFEGIVVRSFSDLRNLMVEIQSDNWKNDSDKEIQKHFSGGPAELS